MTDGWKAKIRAGVVADRLWKCATGDLEMNANQLKAAIAIFDRLEPSLARTELAGELKHKFEPLIIEQRKDNE